MTQYPGPFVLVQSFSDRSGIRNVWGPFTDEPDAGAFEAALRRAGIDGDLWEVFPLESLPELRNLFGGDQPIRLRRCGAELPQVDGLPSSCEFPVGHIGGHGWPSRVSVGVP